MTHQGQHRFGQRTLYQSHRHRPRVATGRIYELPKLPSIHDRGQTVRVTILANPNPDLRPRLLIPCELRSRPYTLKKNPRSKVSCFKRRQSGNGRTRPIELPCPLARLAVTNQCVRVCVRLWVRVCVCVVGSMRRRRNHGVQIFVVSQYGEFTPSCGVSLCNNAT